jgi:gliding motility-associated lipoprotein GldH
MRKTTSHASTNHSDRQMRRRSFDPLPHLRILAILALLFTGCDKSMVFEENQHLQGGSWPFRETLKFSTGISDLSQRYNFYFNIRINSDYKYANLFLFMKTGYPNGKISVDTIECYLADIEGRWLGQRSGNYIDNRILFRRNLKFALAGDYSFEFEQAMRDSTLTSVEDFGIRIEKAE